MDRSLNLLTLALALGLGAAPLSAQHARVPLPTGNLPAAVQGEPVALELPRGEPTLHLFNVADLTGSQGTIPVADQLLETDDAEALLAHLSERELLREQARQNMAALEQAVRTYIEPPLEPGTDTLRVLGDDQLVLQARPAQIAWLTDFLATQRAHHGLVRIRARFWVGPTDMLGDFGLPRAPQHLFEHASEIAALLDRAASSGHELVSSPELVAYPRQLAHASIQRPTSYVSEWILEYVAPDHQPVLDPVIEIVQEGVVVTARAVPLADAHWSVDANVHLSSLMRPIPTEQVQVGDGSYFAQISRPTVAEVKLHSRFSTPSGGGALFVTHDSVEDRDVIVLLQVEDFDAEVEFGAAPPSVDDAPDHPADGRREAAPSDR